MKRNLDVIDVRPAQSVPCNGCTACCEHDLIVLHPECGDVVHNYRTIEAIHPLTGEPVLALAQNADGSCVYLERGKGAARSTGARRSCVKSSIAVALSNGSEETNAAHC